MIFTYLVIRRKFHRSDTVDVFLDFVEEIVPSADNLALVLIVDQVQFIALPGLANLKKYKIEFIYIILLKTYCKTKVIITTSS